jgi:hypothetical protein
VDAGLRGRDEVGPQRRQLGAPSSVATRPPSATGGTGHRVDSCISYPMKWLTPFPTFARGHAEWGACYRGWRLRAVGWPGGWRQAASGGVRSAGCWRNGGRFITQILSRKRGNLSMADDTRTTTQQRTQHAPVAPRNDSCSQLRVIYDCPAVFSASSVHAGGQRRPFRHAFKSQMRSSRASEVHPRSSIQPSKRGGTASCSTPVRLQGQGKWV